MKTALGWSSGSRERLGSGNNSDHGTMELMLSKHMGGGELEECLSSGYPEIFSQYLLRTEFMCHFPAFRDRLASTVAVLKLS